MSEDMNFVIRPTWVGITPPVLITSVATRELPSHLVPEFLHLKTEFISTSESHCENELR